LLGANLSKNRTIFRSGANTWIYHLFALPVKTENGMNGAFPPQQKGALDSATGWYGFSGWQNRWSRL